MLKALSEGTLKALELADFIETLDQKRYDQSAYTSEDGDTHCICGWLNVREGHCASDEKRACDALGITKDVGFRLFSGGAGRRVTAMGRVLRPTPLEAARAIRHVALVGDTPHDW